MTIERSMWTLFEPLHGVTYFAPEAREHFEAVGLRGFWRGYFAGRAAPLGAVDAAPVIAAFFGFAPAMVRRALPDVWTRAAPDAVLAARQAGAVAALSRLLKAASTSDIGVAVDLLTEAAAHVDVGGRVLAAANVALPAPTEPTARLWHATTILREHRGDGHVAALVLWGLDGCEALVWRSSLDLSGDVLRAARGWTDDEWASAADRLRAKGWIDDDGRATTIAQDALRDIEAATDRAARRPWSALGARATERLIATLTPLAIAARSEIPDVNPIGLPRPRLSG